MRPTVHILATVRTPELLKAARLVFQTLAKGFPDNPVRVWGNALDSHSAGMVAAAAAARGASFDNIPATSHDAWIETLIQGSNEPFWICDTDVVFFEPMSTRWFKPATLLAGRYEPEFAEEWTGTRHMERLHTAVMWFNPIPLRIAMRGWMAKIPAPWGSTAQFPLIRQTFVPVVKNGQRETCFYDTCAGLYHALGGMAFTPEQDAAFEHLHCGTYVDQVNAPSLSGLAAAHAQIYSNPQTARGLKAGQDAYYATRQVKQ